MNADQNAAMPVLSVNNLGKTYGEGETAKRAIETVSFDVLPGEFVSLVGPSGAGKTTLLKCLAGLMAPTNGTAKLDGVDIVAPPEKLTLVFQDYSRSLLPWMTILANVEFPLKGKKISKENIRKRANEALSAVGLSDAIKKYPWQLSGGMQQRVAIARGLAYRPEVLLMDEPFASVDAQTRMDLEDLIRPLQEQFGVTVVFVTHDIDEAVYLSDRVVVLSHSPTRVQKIVSVDLPTPRSQTTTKADPRYAALRTEVLELIYTNAAKDIES